MTVDDTPLLEINSDLIRAARKRVNLGLEDASRLVSKLLERDREDSITASDLSRWERGTDHPTLQQAECLAEVYFLPFVALFADSIPEPPISDFRLGARGRARPLSYATQQRLNLYNRLTNASKKIAATLGLLENTEVPVLDPTLLLSDDDIEDAAASLRRSLGVTSEDQLSWDSDERAWLEWRDSVEKLGIFVFTISMPIDECRGASRWEPQSAPTILVNTADKPAARIFTLLHEFSHLAFAGRADRTAICDPARPGTSKEEQLANRLAGSILLPRDLVISVLPDPIPDKEFSRWPPKLRKRLRDELKASYSALGLRLQQLGLLSKGRIPGFWRKPSTFVPWGRRKSRSAQFRAYLGDNTAKLMKGAINVEPGISGELARILDVKVKDVEGIAGSA